MKNLEVIMKGYEVMMKGLEEVKRECAVVMNEYLDSNNELMKGYEEVKRECAEVLKDYLDDTNELIIEYRGCEANYFENANYIEDFLEYSLDIDFSFMSDEEFGKFMYEVYLELIGLLDMAWENDEYYYYLADKEYHVVTVIFTENAYVRNIFMNIDLENKYITPRFDECNKLLADY